VKRYEIKNIDGHATAKILALVWAIIPAFIFLLGSVFAIFSGEIGAVISALLAVVLAPIFYFIFGYLVMRLFCFLYNKLSSKYGGIKIGLRELYMGESNSLGKEAELETEDDS
jgi:choline-glycine betaine transporter